MPYLINYNFIFKKVLNDIDIKTYFVKIRNSDTFIAKIVSCNFD